MSKWLHQDARRRRTVRETSREPPKQRWPLLVFYIHDLSFDYWPSLLIISIISTERQVESCLRRGDFSLLVLFITSLQQHKNQKLSRLQLPTQKSNLMLSWINWMKFHLPFFWIIPHLSKGWLIWSIFINNLFAIIMLEYVFNLSATRTNNK